MPLSQDDRIAFSLKIINTEKEIAGLESAKAQIQVQVDAITKLDQGNKRLFDPFNDYVNAYQLELNYLTGQIHTTIVEQDIQDAAKRTLRNHFFPNDTQTSVPSLAAYNNIWVRFKPFALNYALGKKYSEDYDPTTKEQDVINTAIGYITAAGGFTDIQNTTGQECQASGTCSNPLYTDQATCTLNGFIWTPGPDVISAYPAVQTLKTNLVNTITQLKALLLAEVAVIVTNDENVGRQAQNNAAINDINNVIIPALDLWLSYSDFNTAHGQTTCAGFNGYNANLLAPTKLHSAQLAALLAALNTRLAYDTVRLGQLNTNLGSITQDLTTGDVISSSGFYGQRYSMLVLRLNTLGGSLTLLNGLNTSSQTQDQIADSARETKALYETVIRTSIFAAPASSTPTVHLKDSSFLSPGDLVYVYAEGQEELLRAVKSISGKTVVLSDVVPSKYRPTEGARLYKILI